MKENFIRAFTLFYKSEWFGTLLMLLVGIVLSFTGIILAEVYKNDTESYKVTSPYFYIFLKYIVPLLSLVGKLILTGGFFAFFLKSFQFAKVFRAEVQAVVLGKDHLTRTEDNHKIEIWKNVTHSLCKSSHDELKEQVAEKILERVPFELGYYFSVMHYNYTFELFTDDDGAEYIKIIEVANYTIFSRKEEKNTIKSYCQVIRKDDNYDKSRVLKYIYSIRNESKPLHENEPAIEQLPDNEVSTIYSMKEEICGHDEYPITILIETLHSVHNLVYWKVNVNQFAKGINISFNQNRDLEIDLLSLSGKLDLQKRPFTNTFAYEGLIFPSDGFIFILKKKYEKQ